MTGKVGRLTPEQFRVEHIKLNVFAIAIDSEK